MFFFKRFRSSEVNVTPVESWMIHLTTVASFVVAVLSIVCFAYRITLTIFWLTICFAFVIGWATMPTVKKQKSKAESIEHRDVLWMFGSLLASMLTLLLLFMSRTQESFSSAWQVVTPIVFIFYVMSALFTVRAMRISSKVCSTVVITAFALSTVSVSAIVFRLGFGFDAIMRRAIEQSLLHHPEVMLKPLVGMGQYISVISLSWLTGLSIHLIDRMLVPIILVFVVLPMLFAALRNGWLSRAKKPILGLLCLFAIPLGYFASTTPFNLALEALTLIIGFAPLASSRRIKWLLISLTAIALVTHPFVGFLCALIVTMVLIRDSSFWISVICVPLGAFGVALGIDRLAFSPPSLQRFADTISNLIRIPDLPNLERWFEWSLYAAIGIILAILVGSALVRCLKACDGNEELRRIARLIGGISVGILMSAVIAGFCIRDASIDIKLWLSVIPLCWFPGMAWGLHAMMDTMSLPRRFFASWVIALMLLVSWYAAFAANGVERSMDRGDLDAVEFIDGNAQGIPYVVISSSMMTGAALTDFGFDRRIPTRESQSYAYALPGSILSGYYDQFMNPDIDPLETRLKLNEFVDAPITYLAFSDADDSDGALTKRLEPMTMAQYEIGGNRIIKLKAVGR